MESQSFHWYSGNILDQLGSSSTVSDRKFRLTKSLKTCSYISCEKTRSRQFSVVMTFHCVGDLVPVSCFVWGAWGFAFLFSLGLYHAWSSFQRSSCSLKWFKSFFHQIFLLVSIRKKEYAKHTHPTLPQLNFAVALHYAELTPGTWPQPAKRLPKRCSLILLAIIGRWFILEEVQNRFLEIITSLTPFGSIYLFRY